MKIRVYNYDLSPYTVFKEFSGFSYNNYFGFTSTVKSSSSDVEYFSIFMLFVLLTGQIIQLIFLFVSLI